jgi:hypothetical protein
MGFAKWIFILVGVYIGWRLLNGFLNSQGGYNVQSSQYFAPSYPQIPYGQVAPDYGFVGRGRHHHSFDGYGPTPRTGRPGGSVRW